MIEIILLIASFIVVYSTLEIIQYRRNRIGVWYSIPNAPHTFKIACRSGDRWVIHHQGSVISLGDNGMAIPGRWIPYNYIKCVIPFDITKFIVSVKGNQ